MLPVCTNRPPSPPFSLTSPWNSRFGIAGVGIVRAVVYVRTVVRNLPTCVRRSVVATSPIQVIDLFAGPGGLGEGFSACGQEEGREDFRVALSIEKDAVARTTLRWRAFTRALYGRGVNGAHVIDALESHPRREQPEPAALAGRGTVWREAAEEAEREAVCLELGPESRHWVDDRIADLTDTTRPWVLVGGPPCQAYSLVGRARNKGVVGYEARDDHRHFLYREYLHVLGHHAPPIFVMENVKGILSAQVDAQEVFQAILSDLANPGEAIRSRRRPRYRIFSLTTGAELDDPRESVVRMEEWSVPQRRHRVILVGVRDDLSTSPRSLGRAGAAQVPLRSVIGDLPALRSGLSRAADTWEAWREVVQGTAIRPDLPASLRHQIARASGDLRRSGTLGRGADFLAATAVPGALGDWYAAHPTGRILNHATRGHMASDLQRYFFAAVFAAEQARSPALGDFPPGLLPEHENVKGVANPIFADRFRVQVWDQPSTTVTSHISKDGHYFIHPDPRQCRSLTVREAARLQTFPDDYFFCGPRTEQYRQVGNAVPPFLARRIAEVVRDVLNGVSRSPSPS